MRLSRLVSAALLAALALVGGASAATPKLALFSVRADLAAASHNEFGDVKVWQSEAALASRAKGATLARCGGDCTFGHGWLAFSRQPVLDAGDVVSAKARHRRSGWSIVLDLESAAGFIRFQRLASLSAKARGVPDALVLVLDGTIVAQPLADRLRRSKTTVEIPGLSRANALGAAKLFEH